MGCLRLESEMVVCATVSGFRTPESPCISARRCSRRPWTARALYVDEDFGVELANTVYALDATTIDLCLSMFPWAPFRSTKAAVKLHTLLDLRGSIPTFIHISDGKMHDVNVGARARRRDVNDR